MYHKYFYQILYSENKAVYSFRYPQISHQFYRYFDADTSSTKQTNKQTKKTNTLLNLINKDSFILKNLFVYKRSI